MESVLEWIRAGVFRVTPMGEVFKGDKRLAIRHSPRRNSDRCDLRVDLCHERKKKRLSTFPNWFGSKIWTA